MLKKWIIGIMVTAIALSLSASPSFSGSHSWLKSKRTQKYQKMGVLHMVSVDDQGQWQLDRYEARGAMKYWVWGENFNFSFKGRKLKAHTDYTLIYSMDTANDDYIVLGEGLTDRRGRIYFENSVVTCSMPSESDARFEYGAKILLIPSAVLEEAGPSWSDSTKGFEGTHLIRFLDIDGCGAAVIDEGGSNEIPDEDQEVSGPMPPGFVE